MKLCRHGQDMVRIATQALRRIKGFFEKKNLMRRLQFRASLSALEGEDVQMPIRRECNWFRPSAIGNWNQSTVGTQLP
jgi:hypothetical protein